MIVRYDHDYMEIIPKSTLLANTSVSKIIDKNSLVVYFRFLLLQ